MDIRLVNREIQLTIFRSDQPFVLEALQSALQYREHYARLLYIRYQFSEQPLRSMRTTICADSMRRITDMRRPVRLEGREGSVTYEELCYGLGELARAEYGNPRLDLHDAYSRFHFK